MMNPPTDPMIQSETQPLTPGQWSRFAWVPIPALATAIFVLWMANLQTAYESKVLLAVFNFLFSILASLLVVILIGRSFLDRSTPGLLLIGCGVLIWGTAGAVVPVLFSHGINVMITVHNSLVCLSALCHLTGVILSMKPHRKVEPVVPVLLTAYGGALCAALIIGKLALDGRMPVFFVQGLGGTPVREFILGSTILMFGLTTGILWRINRRPFSAFVNWYGHALLLVALGLLGIMLESVYGSLLSWAGRAAQFMGGAYMLIAAIAAMREKGIQGISVSEVLRESEERFRAAFENGAVPMSLTKPDGTMIKINEAFCRMMGYTEAELRMLTFYDFTFPDDLSVNRAGVQGLLDGSLPSLRMEKRYVRKDGKIIWGDMSAAVVRDSNGNPLYMVTHVQDITERKRVEEALRESERDKAMILDNANEIIAYHDADHNIQWANNAYLDSIGRTLADVQGKKCFHAWGLDRLCVDCPVSKVLETGKAESGELTAQNQPYWPSDQGSWMVRAAPVKNDDGNIIGVIEVAYDITESKCKEEALRQSECRERERATELAALLDAVPTPVFVAYDTECLHLSGNRAADELLRNPRGAEASLSAPGDVKPRHFKAVKNGRELRLNELPAQRAARGEHVRDFEFSLVFDDGTVQYVLGYGTPVLDDEGRPRGAVHVLVDITDRKKVEQSLRERTAELETVNKELESFIYSVAHDLRAPVRTMAGFANFLIQDYADKLDGQGKDFLSRIQAGSEKMNRLIGDLLNLSRINRQEIELIETDLSSKVSSIVAAFREAAPNRNVEVSIQPGIRASADPAQIEIALLNILENAWKFTSKTEKARIEFGATEKDGKTVYFVKDNGAGFEPQYAEKMFLPFHRLHSEKEFEGTGVGLAIVERIIHRHRGKIWAEGKTGKGATAYFTLG